MAPKRPPNCVPAATGEVSETRLSLGDALEQQSGNAMADPVA